MTGLEFVENVIEHKVTSLLITSSTHLTAHSAPVLGVIKYRIHYPILALYMNSIVTQKKQIFEDSGTVEFSFW